MWNCRHLSFQSILVSTLENFILLMGDTAMDLLVNSLYFLGEDDKAIKNNQHK